MRHPISFIGWTLGAIFLIGAIASYLYYERITVSEWLNMYVDLYPYRQYSFIFLILGIVFLVIGIAYSREHSIN
jgi:hypothetical protein